MSWSVLVSVIVVPRFSLNLINNELFYKTYLSLILYLEPPAPARDSSEEHREQTEGARSLLCALIGSELLSRSVRASTVEHFLKPVEKNYALRLFLLKSLIK